jgi:hypothetical protein
MGSPPIPPGLDHLTNRPFAFYPPIVGVEQNEWLYRKATWSEILVFNCKTDTEIWIPRRFIGEVSRVEDPMLIVGLNRELEYKAGTVFPYQKRVLQMPLAVNAPTPIRSHSAESQEPLPAPVVGIRLEGSDKAVFKMIGVAVAIAIGLYVAAVSLTRIGDIRQKTVTFTAADQSFLELSKNDDYMAVVQKLGQPGSDRSRDVGGIQYRALGYIDRKYHVILMGPDLSTAKYIGVLDDNWRPLHSVELHSGGSTLSLLKNLNRF